MSSNSDKENPNMIIGREIAQKFEFYFISLVFTILALSLQTASFTDINPQCIIEISGWFFLALSGLAGLSRLEWLPVSYRHYGSIQKEKNNLNAFIQGIRGRRVLKENDDEWSIEELRNAKGDLETHITKRKEIIDKLNISNTIAYQIHKWGFIVGFFCIIFSRALVALAKMIN
jgi:hypothetical protein